MYVYKFYTMFCIILLVSKGFAKLLCGQSATQLERGFAIVTKYWVHMWSTLPFVEVQDSHGYVRNHLKMVVMTMFKRFGWRPLDVRLEIESRLYEFLLWFSEPCRMFHFL